MSKWIPVSERLPEDDTEYLVTVEQHGKFYLEKELFVNHSWDEEFVWIDDWGREVVAWQPLPEPYKPEENK